MRVWRWLAGFIIAMRRFAHPGESVKGGKAAADVVRISVCFDDLHRQLEVAVLHRQKHRAGAIRCVTASRFFFRDNGILHIRAVLEQHSYRGGFSLACGEEQRGEA